MGEMVGFGQLVGGDWLSEIDGADLGEDLRVVSVQRTFMDVHGRCEYGLLLEDGRAFSVWAFPEQPRVKRADENEKFLLESQAAGDRLPDPLTGKRRARVVGEL